jgi:multicomponent Na+:H+ antiporter subunit G
MNTDLLLEVIAGVCLVLGALMSLAAAIGLLRFPDLLSRMHAATKPQVFGLLLLLIGLALQLRSWAAVPVLIVAWLFQLLTVPVSAHMVGRAGYRTKHLHRETLSVDDLDAVVQKAAAEEAERRRADAAEEAALAADPELAAELDAVGDADKKRLTACMVPRCESTRMMALTVPEMTAKARVARRLFSMSSSCLGESSPVTAFHRMSMSLAPARPAPMLTAVPRSFNTKVTATALRR